MIKVNRMNFFCLIAFQSESFPLGTRKTNRSFSSSTAGSRKSFSTSRYSIDPTTEFFGFFFFSLATNSSRTGTRCKKHKKFVFDEFNSLSLSLQLEKGKIEEIQTEFDGFKSRYNNLESQCEQVTAPCYSQLERALSSPVKSTLG